MGEIKESEAMLEIRRIREKLYEETKNMTFEEIAELERKKVEEIEKELGWKFRRVSKPEKRLARIQS